MYQGVPHDYPQMPSGMWFSLDACHYKTNIVWWKPLEKESSPSWSPDFTIAPVTMGMYLLIPGNSSWGLCAWLGEVCLCLAGNRGHSSPQTEDQDIWDKLVLNLFPKSKFSFFCSHCSANGIKCKTAHHIIRAPPFNWLSPSFPMLCSGTLSTKISSVFQKKSCPQIPAPQSPSKPCPSSCLCHVCFTALLHLHTGWKSLQCWAQIFPPRSFQKPALGFGI